MIQVRKARKGGFTLIELMLAMTFISILLLAITITAIQVGKIYNRGLILSSLNSVGRDLSDTLRRDFLQTDRRQISKGDNGDSVIYISDGGPDPRSARFCLGDYSYLWNTATTLNDLDSSGTISQAVVTVGGQPINLIRVSDPNGSLCQKQSNDSYETRLEDSGRVTHLLKQQADNGEIVLAVHGFQVRSIIQGNEQLEGLYDVKFTLGTSALEEINTTDQSCKPSGDDKSNAEFCAINQFNMIVRTNG